MMIRGSGIFRAAYRQIHEQRKMVEMTGDDTWCIKKQASSKLRDEWRQSDTNADTERHK